MNERRTIQMARLLEDKVALVTGGSSGIGRAAALRFTAEGAKVVVADVNDSGGEEVVRLIREKGGEAIYVRTDVAKASAVETLIADAVRLYGRLDAAFNNAGISIEGRTHEVSEVDWDRLLGINLKGVWLCMKYELIQMLKQGSGAIVNMSSVWGAVGMTGEAAYVASKHGVSGLTKAAALDYAREGIRINEVRPGLIHTPMTADTLNNPARREQIISREPVGRPGTPEEVAAAVVWLCSDESSFVTGHTLAVDGGYLAQ
jgi:NAD(P)-dependent dehydrogenase (short-subunit alcohol dehydrogenase family)